MSLSALDALLPLKALRRAGWVERGLSDVESVAAHAWGVSLLTVALLPEELDLGLALSFAVLHDLAEVEVGDLTPSAGVDATDKSERERAAMVGLCAALPSGGRLLGLWESYEAQDTPEARFVKELDRLDMALQAAHYRRTQGLDPSDFFDSSERVIRSPQLRALLEALLGDHQGSAPPP
ncbi:MAG: HD domain-containing protein, partial [Deltaproteobacteria bacterium]|nr:HD domain-containing protein [Deltaproteobacteria bacterium]